MRWGSEKQFQRRFDQGLDSIPQREAFALILYGTYGYPPEQVGEAMKISAGDAAELIMGGLDKLRQEVFGDLPEHSAIAHALDAERNPSRLQNFADR